MDLMPFHMHPLGWVTLAVLAAAWGGSLVVAYHTGREDGSQRADWEDLARTCHTSVEDLP